jgi:leucyl aminopeptidase
MLPGASNAGISQLFLGLHDALYIDNRFRKIPEKGFKTPKIKSLALLGCTSEDVVEHIGLTYKLSEMISSGVNFAKDLVGAPPNSKTPVVIASLASKIASEHNLEIEILGQKECEDLKMGGYLGVQQGSKFPPQFIHLTYKPENPSADISKVALIGKGLTFDRQKNNFLVHDFTLSSISQIPFFLVVEDIT